MSEQEAQEMLRDMKEKAAFMVDLAYSSVLYDNRDLAEEVYELEEFVDDLNDRFQQMAIRDVKTDELDVSEALSMIQLAMCSEMIADGARAIADVQLRDVELHPIVRESIMESNEVFVRATIDPSSVLAGRSLGEMELASETGMWVIALKRAGRWTYDIGRDTLLQPDDVVLARGAREGMEHFRALTTGVDREI